MEEHQAIAQVIQRAWQQKDLQLLSQNLADPLQWYEGAYDPPLTTPTAVIQQWQQDLARQSNLQVGVEVLDSMDRNGFYHCQAAWTEDGASKQVDGLFNIKLDERGKINYFMPWYSAK